MIRYLPQSLKSILRRWGRQTIGYEELTKSLDRLADRLNHLEYFAYDRFHEFEQIKRDLAKAKKELAFFHLREQDPRDLTALSALDHFHNDSEPPVEESIKAALSERAEKRAGLGNTLELFVGAGAYVRLLCKLSNTYLGLEPSPILLQYHQEKNTEEKALFAPYRNGLLVNDREFDTIFAALERSRWSLFLVQELLTTASERLTPPGELILCLPYDAKEFAQGPLRAIFNDSTALFEECVHSSNASRSVIIISQEILCQKLLPKKRSIIETAIGMTIL